MSSLKESHIVVSLGDSVKRSSSRQHSEVKNSNKFGQRSSVCSTDCLFCGDVSKKEKTYHFSGMINKALYSKYSSSQNYYYTKDVNEILAESRTPAVILFKDFLHADEEEEYLKRFYHYSEYDFKIKMLTEYYKFHNDIARIFILPVIHVVNRYHDKKRRLEYNRVTKMLREEQEAQSPEMKPSEEKKTSQQKDYIITDRVLEDLDLTNSDQQTDQKNSNPSKNTPHNYFGKSTLHNFAKRKQVEKNQLVNKGEVLSNNKNQGTNKDGLINQSKDFSAASNTIHDLNFRLGEIISNSRSYNLDMMNYLDNNEPQPNETMSNLSNFLLYLNKNGPTSNIIDVIPKTEMISPAASKVLNSLPLTDRPYRPELATTQINTKTTQFSTKGEFTPRLSDHILRAVSPTGTKAFTKMRMKHSTAEKSRIKLEDKSSNPNSLLKQDSQNQVGEKPKKIASVAKIKNFEEALKTANVQKGSLQNSSHTQEQEKPISNYAAVKNVNRMNVSKTPSKKLNEKLYESSVVTTTTTRQQAQPLSSTNTSRPSSRTKTRSTDMYNKALDLLLGSNQILLGNQSQKGGEKVSQTHRSTKSSFNFKVKASNQQPLFSSQNERSLGKDDNTKIDSGLMSSSSHKIVSHKLASDRLYLQTEREIKKMGAFGNLNLDIQRRDIRHGGSSGSGALSEREMQQQKDCFFQKEKESNRSQVKGMKAIIVMPNEVETTRSCFNSQGEQQQRKIGFHKYTKSEGRIMKRHEEAVAVEKIEIINDVKSLMNGSGRSKGGKGNSPRRQTFIQNQNNIINVFVNSTNQQEKKTERTLTLKTERQAHQEGLYHGEMENYGRIFKSRSPNSEVLIKFNQSLPKKLSLINNDVVDYKNHLDYSPLRRTKHKDSTVAQQMRISSDKSPSSHNVGFQQRRTASKSEFETFRRDLRFDNFEIHSRSKEKS